MRWIKQKRNKQMRKKKNYKAQDGHTNMLWIDIFLLQKFFFHFFFIYYFYYKIVLYELSIDLKRM